jgi:hypothetical protein
MDETSLLYWDTLCVRIGGRLDCFVGGGTLGPDPIEATGIWFWVETGLLKFKATSRLSIGTSSCFEMSFTGAKLFLDSGVLGTQFRDGASVSGTPSCTVKTCWTIGDSESCEPTLLFS